MATYGRGQMLGSGVNPESFKLDYSGMANAAATQAQGISNLGASIGGAISEVGDYFKKQAEDEKKVQKSLSVAKAIGDLIPGLQPTIQGSLNILNDKELPLSQRTAEADAIADILNLGINEVRNRQDVGFKERELNIQEAEALARNAPSQRNVNLQQGEITETINGKQYKVPTTFDPATGETRRLDGSVVSAGFRDSAIIDTGLNLSFPQFESVPDGGVLNPLPNAIAAAADLTGGQSDVSNVSPMPMGTPTITQAPVVDGIPTGQAGTGMIPPGATPVEGKSEEGKIMSQDEIIKLMQQGFKVSGRPAENGGVFVTDVQSLAPQIGKEVVFNPDGTLTTRDIPLASGLNKAPTTSLKEGEVLVEDPNSPTGTKIVQIPSEAKEKAQNDFTAYISQVGDSYARLDKMGKAVSAGKANPLNYVFSTPAGQTMARMFGEEGQTLRDDINTMAPNIINVIRQSTQMGSKGMDSNAEREFYIKAMGDPTLPIEANIKALDALDKAYGKGNAIESIVKNYPDLAKKVNAYKLTPPKAPASSIPRSEEIEAIRKKYLTPNAQ